MALAAPPEFAARALLRSATRVSDKAARQELLEMAFRLAAKAQNPLPLLGVPGTEIETRTGSLASALRLKLDALSLQVRAVQELTAIDPARAREVFNSMPRLSAASLGCESSLVPDVSPYYEALAALQGSFSAAERSQGTPAAFVTAALSRMGTLGEVAPAARMLLSLDWSAADFKAAADVFTNRLGAMPLDSRAFLYYSKTIDGALALLVPRMRQLGLPAGRLSETYRKFLVNQFRGPHCSDSGVGSGVMFLPSSLFGPAIRGDEAAIATEETVPASYTGEIKVDRYWPNGQAERIYQTCLALRQGPQGDPISDPARHAREWANQVSDFLTSLNDWSTGDEALERDYFHEKAIVHAALLETVPEGDIGDRVIASYVELLKSSNVQRRNTVEWFWRASWLVNQLRTRHPAEAAKLQAAYRASGNIVLMLESMLDQVAP